MRNALLAAVIMSSLLLVGCNRTDEISEDEPTTGIGYGQENGQSSVKTTEGSTTQTEVIIQEETTVREKTNKAIDQMDNAVQQMSEEFADTVDTMKKGAEDTVDDMKQSIDELRTETNPDASSTDPEVDNKLQEMKKDLNEDQNSGSQNGDTELNL